MKRQATRRLSRLGFFSIVSLELMRKGRLNRNDVLLLRGLVKALKLELPPVRAMSRFLWNRARCESFTPAADVEELYLRVLCRVLSFGSFGWREQTMLRVLQRLAAIPEDTHKKILASSTGFSPVDPRGSQGRRGARATIAAVRHDDDLRPAVTPLAPAECAPAPGLASARRQTPADARPRGWIVSSSLFLVAALVTGMFLRFGVIPQIQTHQSPLPRPADPAFLRIWSLEGTADVSSGQADVGLALRPGDDLRTADGGRALLKDKAGNRVELGAASSIAFEAVDSKTSRSTDCRYALAGLAGRVLLDFRFEESVTIRDRRGWWALSRGVVRFEETAGSAVLAVEEGTVVLREAGRAVQTVVAGGRVLLELGGRSSTAPPGFLALRSGVDR